MINGTVAPVADYKSEVSNRDSFYVANMLGGVRPIKVSETPKIKNDLQNYLNWVPTKEKKKETQTTLP